VPTHYDTLKVSRDAPPEVIQAAYRSLARKYHPDHHRGTTSENEAAMKAINAAYEVLSAPDRRAAYDRHLAQNLARANSSKSRSRSRRDPDRPADDFRRTLITILISVCYFGAAFLMLRNPGLRYVGILMLLFSLYYFRPRRR